MNPETQEYFRRRELTERAAAKRASSPEARRVHQELAQAYWAALKAESEGSTGQAQARPQLSIVVKAR